MKCLKCGFENAAVMRFCGQCGERLAQHEVNCKESKPVSESVRKQVTALFSDITGYTAMSERIDPEEVKDITDQIFQGAAEIVARYDGFIEHFAGDSILALFGVSKSHGDEPVRALHAVCEIHEMVESLSLRHEIKREIQLSMHSGVNTGLAVTADIDPVKGTHRVTGNVINVAARLSDLAQAREILVGYDTYRACKNHFNFNPLKPVIVKGKLGQIPIYQLLSQKALTFSSGLFRHISSEMVGRDKDLEKLALQVIKTVNGEGSVVNVIGEAGIGKSRLIAELKQRKEMQQVMLLEGLAVSIGKNLSFHPIIDILKQWAQIAEKDSEAMAFAKLESAIQDLHPEESDEIIPFTATLMGMKLAGKYAKRVKGIEGDGLEKLILKSLRELLIKRCESQPVIIIIEDLHWADESSIKLLKSLYRLVEKYRITFINALRPGYLDENKGAVIKIGEKLSGHYAEIQLQPLEKNDSETLINNILDTEGFPLSVKTRIVERAGGNPFFIEEIVSSLIDEGAIVPHKGRFEITGRINFVVIPPTINEILTAKLDRLEGRTRELIKIAAVIGRNFFDCVIKDVADSIDDVNDRLSDLKDMQLLKDRIRMQELEYQFKHELIHEAVYESTLIQQRKMLHIKVAESIEKLFKDRLNEFYGLLSYHYGKGENHEKAEKYLIKAGEESLRTSASNEALTYFQEGHKLFFNKHGDVDPEKLIVLEKNIALAFCRKGNFVEGLKHYDQVIKRLGVPQSKNRLTRTLHLLADLLIVVARLYISANGPKRDPDLLEKEIFETTMRRNEILVIADTKRVFPAMVRLLRESNSFDITKTANGFRLWIGTGTVFSYMGISFKIARKFLERSMEMVNQDKAEDMIAFNNSDAMYKHCAGLFNEINGYDYNLVDRCLKSGEMFYISAYTWSVGSVMVEKGNFADALAIIDNLTNIAEIYDHEQTRIVALGLKLHLKFKIRDFSEAQRLADDRFSLADELGLIINKISALGYKIMIHAMMNDIDRATELVTQAEDLITVKDRLPPYCFAPYLAGRFINDINILAKSMHSGNSGDVTGYKNKALQSGKNALRNILKYVPPKIIVFKSMGDYYWLIREQKTAMKWWMRAIRAGEQMSARPDLARTYFEVGRRLLETGSQYRKFNGMVDANSYLEKAKILFEKMELETDIKELEQVQSDYL